MQLHLHNHLFCFSTAIIHFFMMHKVYTLITKHARNAMKTMREIKQPLVLLVWWTKQTRTRHRTGSFLFFLYFRHLSCFMGTVFIVESCSSTFDEHKSLHRKFIFCFRKDLWWNPGHAGINRPLLFSSVVSQQFQYFHKQFLNKVQKKKNTLHWRQRTWRHSC